VWTRVNKLSMRLIAKWGKEGTIRDDPPSKDVLSATETHLSAYIIDKNIYITIYLQRSYESYHMEILDIVISR